MQSLFALNDEILNILYNYYLSNQKLEDKKLMDEILEKGRNTKQITSNVLQKSIEYLEKYYHFFIDLTNKKQLLTN